MKKKITKIEEPQVKILISQAAAEVAYIVNDRLYKEVLETIRRGAIRGKYRIKWRLPLGLRGGRIPQDMKSRLEAEGFYVEQDFGLFDYNTVVGLTITWGKR